MRRGTAGADTRRRRLNKRDMASLPKGRAPQAPAPYHTVRPPAAECQAPSRSAGGLALVVRLGDGRRPDRRRRAGSLPVSAASYSADEANDQVVEAELLVVGAGDVGVLAGRRAAGTVGRNTNRPPVAWAIARKACSAWSSVYEEAIGVIVMPRRWAALIDAGYGCCDVRAAPAARRRRRGTRVARCSPDHATRLATAHRRTPRRRPRECRRRHRRPRRRAPPGTSAMSPVKSNVDVTNVSPSSRIQRHPEADVGLRVEPAMRSAT